MEINAPHTAREAISPDMQTVPQPVSSQSSMRRSSILRRTNDDVAAAAAETANVRFLASVLVFAAMNIVLVFASPMSVCDSALTRMLASLIVPFIGFFGYQWCYYYSPALTRRKRAFWVEPNILLTYQPRARYMGHLFKPDPPTPGVTDRDVPGMLVVDDAPEQQETEGLSQEEIKNHSKRKAAFESSRNKHYGGEWAAAMKGLHERANSARNNLSDAAAFPLLPSNDVSLAVAETISSETSQEKKKSEVNKNKSKKSAE
ncbi:hypothetical protein DdX_05936 [Ditylenchus destructor]|uniref:Uncharacterized protein n=1 Tax=Ditylenchus destructor TaxID=166010 RepID=A0AAD4R9H6_9BILA|nr:hypothetical protein DdX_05936 [Ditylenchus destructor]